MKIRNLERSQRIAVLYATGVYDMTQIGKAYGLTRERVRQLLVEFAGETGFSAHEVRAAVKEIEAAQKAKAAAPVSVERRFFSFVAVDGETGCWQWTGALFPTGYASFWSGKEDQYGHRWAVKRWIGQDAYDDGDRLHTDHLCRNRGCVNPDHLEVVTCQENLLRSPLRRGSNTHCRKGHEYTDENTRYASQGKYTWRDCRACKREYDRKYRQEKKKRAA